MSEEITNTGFSKDSSPSFSRIINSDGSYNIQKKGTAIKWKDAYKYLIEISWPRFFFMIILFYSLLNIIFTVIYWCIGFQHISGIDPSEGSVFMQALFFSAQTFTTVGYGVMSPTGFLTQLVSSIEALTGFLSFSLMTGLLYGRFSKPAAKIMFSQNAVIAPYKDITSFQIKLANERDNVLLDVNAKMILVFDKPDSNGETKKHFFRLPLEISEISLLPLSWTVVHPINEESPFYNKTESEIKSLNAEVLVMVSGYDEVFSQVVNARTSYYYSEILLNWKFKKIFATDKNGNLSIDLANLDAMENLNKENGDI
ncbi:MAG: ion channel [Crocinitomicaceae bacterium]